MTNPTQRLFKIGTTLITEDATLAGKSLEEVRTLLKPAYPEIAHAVVRQIILLSQMKRAPKQRHGTMQGKLH